jgi:hypothetical protein
MTGSTCAHCGHIHGAADAPAVDRFSTDGPVGYRAVNVPDAPLRPTRAEAIADACAHRMNAANGVLDFTGGAA